MSPRTLTSPPTDRSKWRLLLALVHPDRGGDHDFFIWVRALYDHVAGDGIEDPPRRPAYERERRSPDPVERVPYHDAFNMPSFNDLTRRVLDVSDRVEEPYARILALVYDCAEEPRRGALYKQQHQGATYKTLAAIAYAARMTKAERTRCYRIVESVPLSQRHARDILATLKRQAA